MNRRKKGKHKHTSTKKQQPQKSSDSLTDAKHRQETERRHHHNERKHKENTYETKKRETSKNRETGTKEGPSGCSDQEFKVYTLYSNKYRDLPPEPRDVTNLPTEAAVERKRRRMPSYCQIILLPMFATMSKITENLFLTSIGGMTQENFEKYQIKCIINATFEVPNLKQKGIESIRVPVDDSPLDDIQEFFDQVADKINERTLEKINIVVHCVAGVSRSASLILAYLMKFQKMDLHSSFTFVHSKRPVIRPNNGFFKQLLNYEMKLFGKNSCKMVQLHVNGVNIEIPDFFQTEHRGLIILESLKEKSKSEASRQNRNAESSISKPDLLLQKHNQPENEKRSHLEEIEKQNKEDHKKEMLLRRFVLENTAEDDQIPETSARSEERDTCRLEGKKKDKNE